eukprot:7427375-Pyramimonas_sp.AAC.1
MAYSNGIAMRWCSDGITKTGRTTAGSPGCMRGWLVRIHCSPAMMLEVEPEPSQPSTRTPCTVAPFATPYVAPAASAALGHTHTHTHMNTHTHTGGAVGNTVSLTVGDYCNCNCNCNYNYNCNYNLRTNNCTCGTCVRLVLGRAAGGHILTTDQSDAGRAGTFWVYTCDVCPVAVAVLWVVVVVHDVAAPSHAAGELRMTRADAGVHDVDVDPRAGARGGKVTIEGQVGLVDAVERPRRVGLKSAHLWNGERKKPEVFALYTLLMPKYIIRGQ